jgi:ABC-type polysaccharide transport system permease subunit
MKRGPVLLILPFVAWVAIVTSVVQLAALFAFGDLSPRVLAILTAWCGAAAYLQFFGVSPAVSAAGLALQTLLAICLILRWRLAQ